MTNNSDDFHDQLSDDLAQAVAHAHADEAHVLNLLGIDPIHSHRRDPEPAQVRDRWED